MKKNIGYVSSKETSFCYARWETERRVFAEEALRIRFVRTLGPTAAKLGCSIASFCILEDSVHILFYTDNPRLMRERDTVHRVLEDKELYLPDTARSPGILRESTTGWTIHGGEEAVHFCSDIHLMALRKGYARELNSYWFSSWQTYRGAYYWNGLRTDSVLQAFSSDPEQAAALFRHYQQQQAHAIAK